MLGEFFEGNQREAIRFMRAHASCVIVVPQPAVIEKLVLEKQIATALDRDPSARTVTRLHTLHNLPKRGISKIYKRVSGTGVAQKRRDQGQMQCRGIRLSRFLRAVRV
jgi:hypothetical protein